MNLSANDFWNLFGFCGDMIWQNLYNPITILLLVGSLFFLWVVLSPKN